MKFLFLLIFFPLFSFAQSNQQLQGFWVKVDAKMKDGSRIINHQDCGMNFIKYNFGNDGFVNQSGDVLFDQFKLPYKLMGDSLVIGGTVYNVVGFANDTLKLSFFVPGAEDAQLPVFYFAKAQEHNLQTTATFDAGLKDSVYQANNQLFPQYRGHFTDLMSGISTRYDKGTLKASFVVDKKGRVKNYTIVELDSISKGFAKNVGNAFADLTWLPARKNNVPVNTVVQVTMRSAQQVIGNRIMNTLDINYQFIAKNPYGKLDADEAEAEQRLFREALNQSNGQDYNKALASLSKCIEMDSIDLNAYYLRAIVNLALHKTQDACKDWATLAAFGQVDAKKKLAKFCKN